MLTTLVHVRLLTTDRTTIGWTVAPVTARGDGQLWSDVPVAVTPETSGEVTHMSVHWPDVNVEARTAVHALVTAGQAIRVFDAGPIFKVGPPPVDLPPLVVRTPVRIGVPIGLVEAKPT
jgi:hypothetical protein